MGAKITGEAGADGGWTVAIEGEAELAPQAFLVPADPRRPPFRWWRP
ncbi:MAG: hypothetical protein R3D28_11935 [Geminicoccaceae bacterium]